jgi:hypothetical protein
LNFRFDIFSRPEGAAKKTVEQRLRQRNGICPTAPSAEKDDAPWQRPDLGSEQLLDLGHEVLKPVQLKRPVDQPAFEIVICNDDFA